MPSSHISSMAATRRAQKLNVNPPAEKANGANGAAKAEPDDGLTELQRAEMQLQELEDDEEIDELGHDAKEEKPVGDAASGRMDIGN